MSKPKHTPGNWEPMFYRQGAELRCTVRAHAPDSDDPEDWPVIVTTGVDVTQDVDGMKADLRLICAAPDLLAALKDLAQEAERAVDMAASQGSIRPRLIVRVNRALAAIAKAEGEP